MNIENANIDVAIWNHVRFIYPATADEAATPIIRNVTHPAISLLMRLRLQKHELKSIDTSGFGQIAFAKENILSTEERLILLLRTQDGRRIAR